jgi:hypothetical protein
MNEERKDLLNLATLPARLTRTEAAAYLGFTPDHLTFLMRRGLLKPLGRPGPTGDKYFAAVKLAELRQNVKWLADANLAFSQHWEDKNARKCKRREEQLTNPDSAANIYQRREAR